MNLKPLLQVLILSLFLVVGAPLGAATAPPMGTAADFVVLGGSTVTNTGSSVLTGDLGVWPGLAISGFPPGTVNGTTHAGDAVALQAQSDLVTAYNDLAGQACDLDLTNQDLGGMTLPPGAYCFDAAAELTGTLTLDALGDPNAVFVFQIGSTLTTASNAVVDVINGGSDCNVYWQVGSSATLGTGTSFAGNILALTSITTNTSAGVSGQLLARNGAVTLDTLTASLCAAVCPAITVDPPTLPSGELGVPYSETITASGGSAPHTFSVTAGALPPGLTLDSNSGLLSGAPSSSGTFTFTITATDQNGCPGSRQYTLTINPAIGCPVLTILPPTLPNAVLGAAYSEPITASGSTPDTYVYTVTGTPPTGLALTPTTPPAVQTVDLAGVPSAEGSFDFTITATDADGCEVSQAYTMLVNPNPCPTITVAPATLPNPSVGEFYSETISASGGVPPYSFAVTSGELPPPLTLDSISGLLSGTPTTAGTFDFTITATDANDCPGTEDYSLGVGVLTVGIPTLSEWTMILLTILLATSGLVAIRRGRFQPNLAGPRRTS